MEKLKRSFYLEDTVSVAKNLLGKQLVHIVDGRILAVTITETEAYTGINDKACHSYGGRHTGRTEVMYHLGGYSYIYLIYGMYYLFNIVTEQEGNPCAVLIRGGEVSEGHDEIAQNRFGKNYSELTPRQIKTLLDGPGKICTGLSLTKAQNGVDLSGDALFIRKGNISGFEIAVDKRIGIDYAQEDAELPYRFFIK